MRQPVETKALAFEGIGFDEAEGTLEGIAAVFGNWDRAGERIDQGACAKSIRERGHKIPMGLDHIRGFGLTDRLEEVSRADLPAAIRSEYPDATGGLACKGRVVLSDENIRSLARIRDRAASGQPVGMSITYRVLREAKASRPGGGDGRVLQELALNEWGPQLGTRPVNPAAMVTEAKAAKGWDMTLPGSDEERRRQLSDALRAAGFFGTTGFDVQAVLPDSVIVAAYPDDGMGEHVYRVVYATGAGPGGFQFDMPVEVDIRPQVVEKAEALQAIVAEAAAAMKAGAVLSAANLQLVDAAIEALSALRAAASKTESATDTGATKAEPAAVAAPADALRPDLGQRLRLSLAAMQNASQRVALLPRGI